LLAITTTARYEEDAGGNFVTQLLVCAGGLAVIMPPLVKAWRGFEHVEQRIWDHYDMPEGARHLTA
jgi:hypothetical protein